MINIPAGRYYIVAGRLDNLAYYPGGTDRTKAIEVSVEPAKTTSVASFTVRAESRRPPSPVVARMGIPDPGILQQIAAERNPERKMKLMLDFEKNNPASSRLPEVFMQLSRAYVSQSDLPKAIQYADKAVNTTAKLKREPPPASYPPAMWMAWLDSIEESAKITQAWVKQTVAWQQKELQSAILRRR